MTFVNIVLVALLTLLAIFWYLVVEKFSINYRTRLSERGKMGFSLRSFFGANVKAPGESSSIHVKEGLVAEISNGRLTAKSRVTRALTREI